MEIIYRTIVLFNLLLFGIVGTGFAQNPTVHNGVATYHSNKNIGRKFEVPNSWNKIVINANVTITGSFYMPTRTSPIEIMGKNRNTSIIQGDGSRPTDDFNDKGEPLKGRSYSAIRADKSPDVYIHDLKITRPMKFHIAAGFGNVTVERCNIIAGSETHTTDGIHGGRGKTIVKDCYIDVFDDALYTIECKLVENTTIVHNQNGGPFMTSWGAPVPDNHTCIVRNCTVIANSNSGYNHGVFSWSQKHDDYAQTMHVKIEGTFDYIINPGKKAAPMYTIGRPRDLTGLKNATLKIDGNCLNSNSVEIRENPGSNQVTFVNCGGSQSDNIFIDHNASGRRLRGNATNAVTTQNGGIGDWVQWVQEDTNNGYFYLIHKATGKKLQGKGNNDVVLVDPSSNGTWEQWKWVDAGGGWYRLENRGHNRWLHVMDNGVDNFTLGPKTWMGNRTKWKYATTSNSRLTEEVDNMGQLLTEEKPGSIKFYPNPTFSVLEIAGLSDQTRLDLRDISGKIVKSRIGSGKMDVSSLRTGIYIIEIDGEFQDRLIKK